MQRKKPVAIMVGIAIRSMAMNAAEIREIEERLRLMQTYRWVPAQDTKPRAEHTGVKTK
jgi:hypothetical protein